MPENKVPAHNRYEVLILTIFRNHYRKGVSEFEFDRSELETVAGTRDVKLPKNLGDLIYSFPYRRGLPYEILATETEGREWIIEPAGRAKYRFRLAKISHTIPSENRVAIKIPDSTPKIISAYALNDELALLAKVRYNCLIDIFLGLTTYSLQNHMRTTVKGMGQIEIDEVYVGVNRNGQQFVIPVQAKGGSDQLATVQTSQDIACCAEKFPNLACRPVSAQFMEGDVIAMFELTLQRGDVKVVEERHYCLVPSDQIEDEDLRLYSSR
jgi:hypothetical protein